MYQIAIIPNNTDANLSLSFKTKDAAQGAIAYIRERMAHQGMIDQQDDFGYVLLMDAKDIAYVLFIDIEQSQFCQHEKNLSIARAARKLVEQVNGDPEAQALLGINQGSNANYPPSRIIQ